MGKVVSPVAFTVHAGVMMYTIRSVLRAYQEEVPSCLHKGPHDKGPQLDTDNANEFLDSRVVFYPGSGQDLHDLDVFGGAEAAHCFVHADYDYKFDAKALQYDGYEVLR